MNTPLIIKARQNRIAALKHLREVTQTANSDKTVVELSAVRSRRKAAPVFFSHRAKLNEQKIAA